MITEQKFAALTVRLWRLHQRWHKQQHRWLHNTDDIRAFHALTKTNQAIAEVLGQLYPH